MRSRFLPTIRPMEPHRRQLSAAAPSAFTAPLRNAAAVLPRRHSCCSCRGCRPAAAASHPLAATPPTTVIHVVTARIGTGSRCTWGRTRRTARACSEAWTPGRRPQPVRQMGHAALATVLLKVSALAMSRATTTSVGVATGRRGRRPSTTGMSNASGQSSAIHRCS